MVTTQTLDRLYDAWIVTVEEGNEVVLRERVREQERSSGGVVGTILGLISAGSHPTRGEASGRCVDPSLTPTRSEKDKSKSNTNG